MLRNLWTDPIDTRISPVTTTPPTYELAGQVDITKLPLTPQEGFVASRLFGRRMALTEIIQATGLPAAQVTGLVQSLVQKGALVVDGGADAAAKPPERSDDPYAGVVFPLPLIQEQNDLNDEQKKRILHVEMNLDTWTHYRLLGVRRSASGADIKAAFFKASKEFHPDAFFRKNLGSYGERLDRIFRAMKAGYDVLTNTEKRAVYDETVGGELSPEEVAELEAMAVQKRQAQDDQARLDRTAERLKEQRLKRNPLAERLKKGRELFRAAEEAKKAGRIDEAVNHARMALTYDDGLKDRAAPIFREADRQRAVIVVKRLQAAITLGDTPAVEELQRALDSSADIAEHLKEVPLMLDLARLLMTCKKAPRAFRLAYAAAEAAPQSARAWEQVAEIAFQEQKWALLQRAAERWLVLEPQQARPKELLKQARGKN